MIELYEETYYLWTRCDIRFRFTCEQYSLTRARKQLVTSVGSPKETKTDWSEFIRPVPCITKRMKRNVWRPTRTHAGLRLSLSLVNTP